MSWLSSRTARQILMALLIGGALVSVFRGAQNGYHNSQDFQWSGARMLLDHIDPWRETLAHDPLHHVRLTQNPNYLPMLYVMLAPLGLLPPVSAQVIWVFCNICFAITSAWIAARFFRLGSYGTAAAICALLTSTPTRMTIGNGQQGLFVLFFWSLGLLTLRLTDARSSISGFSYLKFNFAPPLAIYLWLREGFRSVFFSLLPAAGGTLLLWLWLTGGRDLSVIGWLIVAPVKVSKIGYYPSGGGINLMDVLELPMYAAHMHRSIVEPLSLCVALAVCFAILYRVTRGRTPASVQCHMALLGILSFGLFKHHFYDSVVLIFTVCYLARLRRHRPAQIALGLLGYVWYAQRAVDHFLPGIQAWTFIPETFMLMTVIWLIFKLRPLEDAFFSPWSALPAFPHEPRSAAIPASK